MLCHRIECWRHLLLPMFRYTRSILLVKRLTYSLSHLDCRCPLLHQPDLYPSCLYYECSGDCTHSTMADLGLLPCECVRDYRFSRCDWNAFRSSIHYWPCSDCRVLARASRTFALLRAYPARYFHRPKDRGTLHQAVRGDGIAVSVQPETPSTVL